MTARFMTGLRRGVLLAGWGGWVWSAVAQTSAPPSRVEPPAVDHPAGRALKYGRSALEDELYPLAEKQFRASMELAYGAGERAASAVWLARSLIAQNRAGEAVALLKGLGNTAAGTEDVAYWLARAQYESGDTEAALATLAGAGGATTAERLALQGRGLARLQRVPEAQSAFAEFERRFPGDPFMPRVLFDWAQVLWTARDFSGANGVLDRLIARFPSHAVAMEGRLLLARVKMAAGKWNEAEPLLKSLADHDAYATSDRAQALLILASGYEKVSNTNAALMALDRGLELARATRWASAINLSKARLLIGAGQVDEGRRRLREVAGQDPRDEQVAATQLFLARRLLDTGTPARAAEEFQYYLDTFEDAAGVAEAHQGKGWALLAMGRPSEAATEFEQAAVHFTAPPQQQEARRKAADAWFAAQAYERAWKGYAALNSDAGAPDRVTAAYLAARCLRAMNRPADAEKAFAQVEQSWPGSIHAGRSALYRALILEERQDSESALRLYSETLTRYADPELQSRARLGRGLLRYRLGLFTEARSDFDPLAADGASGPYAEQAFFMRGWCAYLQGRDAEALKICRAFVQRYPESAFTPDVRFWLAEHAYNQGDFASAEREFAGLATRHGTSPLAPEALFWAGRSAMAEKEYLRAIETFNRLTRDYPASPRLPDARFAQGDALSELGRFPEAILAFDEIIRKSPDSFLADLAWGRKGDCHFTLGAEEPQRYDRAIQCYKTVRDQPRASVDLRLQADYKIGRCEEKLGHAAAALERYMSVVYGHRDERERGRPGAPLWFARAAFGGGALLEQQEKWREALNVYRRIVEEGGPAAREADNRIRRIRLEKWMVL